MNELCHTMSHIWMNLVIHLNGSCHTYEWVMSRTYDASITSHVWMCHLSYEWDTTHTYECATSYMNETWHTRMIVPPLIWMRHDTHIWMCHLPCEWDTTHTYECATSYMNETWHTHMNAPLPILMRLDTHIWMNAPWHSHKRFTPFDHFLWTLAIGSSHGIKRHLSFQKSTIFTRVLKEIEY